MTVLLHILEHRGFTVTAEGGALRVSPGSRLTDELRFAIRERKAELLAMLSRPDSSDLARFLAWGEAHGWPGMQAGSVEVAHGEAAWRTFAERCNAADLAPVLALCWWYPGESPEEWAAPEGSEVAA